MREKESNCVWVLGIFTVFSDTGTYPVPNERADAYFDGGGLSNM